MPEETLYTHLCTGCYYSWCDQSTYRCCPWCGGSCSNDLFEESLNAEHG